MAKNRKIGIGDLKLNEKMANALEGKTELQKNKPVNLQNTQKTELQKNTNTELSKKESRKDNKKYKTIRINERLHRKAKFKAFQEGEKVGDYIEKLIEIGLENIEY